MVTVGPKIGNASKDKETFIAYQFIENGVSGFWSDSEKELKGYIRDLLGDENLQRSVSIKGRESALKHFSFERNKQDWKEILEKL
jgi:glycosyltransferase involved in cell wall biosynthesis